MKEKSEAFGKFKRFKLTVEQDTKEKIRTLRTDRGGEFISREFNDFCEEMGIKRHLTAPYTQQQNGVVERRNRTLMEMTRSILKHMAVPNYMWGEATRHSTYLLNRVATRVLKNVTPYEALRGRKPNVNHLKTFGCIGYAKTVKPHLQKLEDRSHLLVHLGTEPDSKAYRMYDPQTQKIVVSRDVVFDEAKGWNWRQDSSEQNLNGSFSITLGEFGNHGIQKDHKFSGEVVQQRSGDSSGDTYIATSTEVLAKEENNDEGEDETEETEVTLRRSMRQSSKPKYLDDYVLLAEEEGEYLLMCLNDEPRSYEEARETKEWTDACSDEIESIEKNRTWELVELPIGAKAIGLKWIFKVKRNSDGSINKHKARLVAKGYVQVQGIYFDEVFAPVARIKTIRLLISLAASNGWEIHHMDVKTAFLHGELKETVFVTQPKGFEVKGSESKVY